MNHILMLVILTCVFVHKYNLHSHEINFLSEFAPNVRLDTVWMLHNDAFICLF